MELWGCGEKSVRLYMMTYLVKYLHIIFGYFGYHRNFTQKRQCKGRQWKKELLITRAEVWGRDRKTVILPFCLLDTKEKSLSMVTSEMGIWDIPGIEFQKEKQNDQKGKEEWPEAKWCEIASVMPGGWCRLSKSLHKMWLGSFVGLNFPQALALSQASYFVIHQEQIHLLESYSYRHIYEEDTQNQNASMLLFCVEQVWTTAI